jgi:hypothetical protein
LSTSGPSATNYQFPILLKEFLGLNVNLVIYPSTSAGNLAIERKEVDGRAGFHSVLKPFIERGLVRPFIRGRVSEPGIEHLPVDEELATDPVGKAIMVMRSGTDEIGRPYVAPPGVPPEVMSLLREAFAKAANDPALNEEAKKSMMGVRYVSADECLKVYNVLLNQAPDVVKESKKYIKF